MAISVKTTRSHRFHNELGFLNSLSDERATVLWSGKAVDIKLATPRVSVAALVRMDVCIAIRRRPYAVILTYILSIWPMSSDVLIEAAIRYHIAYTLLDSDLRCFVDRDRVSLRKSVTTERGSLGEQDVEQTSDVADHQRLRFSGRPDHHPPDPMLFHGCSFSSGFTQGDHRRSGLAIIKRL